MDYTDDTSNAARTTPRHSTRGGWWLVYLNTMAGYHLRQIVTKGIYGETSKIREELEELEEAGEQKNRILQIVEISDLYGALEAVAERLGVTMLEVAAMAAATKRAFQSGERQSDDLDADEVSCSQDDRCYLANDHLGKHTDGKRVW